MEQDKFKRFDQADGITKEVYLCTPNKKVTIREINGDDEDTLSLVRDSEDNSAIAKFVSKVVVSPRLTFDEVQQWRARDKYLILFEAVRLTYGDVFKFEYTFDEGSPKEITYEFEEDLRRFTWDFNPKNKDTYPGDKSNKNYFKGRIKPYIDDLPSVEFTTSSGKKVGFEYLTGELESAALLIDQKDRSLNDELRDRNFYQEVSGVPTKISNFGVFRAIEMREIRMKIEEHDPSWPAILDIKHPSSGKSVSVSLFSLPDFFFRRLL